MEILGLVLPVILSFEELLRKRRRFSAPVLGGKFLATNHLIAQAISALKGQDCTRAARSNLKNRENWVSSELFIGQVYRIYCISPIEDNNSIHMAHYKKRDFPISNVRRFLEPGPIVLVSSAWKGSQNIMTMGWHMIMEFEPSLIGCYIWDENYSFELIRKSKECVINIPTVDLATTVVKIGNCSGRDIDKFKKFHLTPAPATKIHVPLIKECYANFECKLVDSSLIKKYSLFVLQVVKAHVAVTPKFPQTIHYRGDGLFMISGPTVKKYQKYFKTDRL